ncbi:hypothetical protein Pcinc_024575 [Petrolisthes cinctipes]|uniref:Tc1-like transposase DDE domain-containing protein n=1 Tax=Petrolisthes cinctipes TaxID=88211 RepID=A0AAE1KE75_PETCI|nr:hypothetical protein Pcinc_024575 [Petrolisthes cinctipes]
MSVSRVRDIVNTTTTSSPSTPVPPPPPTLAAFDNFTVGAIRRHIHIKFFEKQHFTLRVIAADLKTAGIIPEDTSDTTVWRIMHTMGFQYRLSQRKMYVRRESMDVVCRRIGALRALQRHREEGRKVVYVDETWFTTRMGHSREWVDTTQAPFNTTYSRQLPPGEGERFVVVAAGTDEGFVDGSYLCYPAKTNQGDYHGEMNGELFMRWLTMQLLPSLPEPSVLVLDNAPYHSQLTEESRCPTTATRKADLIRWLEQHNISIPPAATRPELLFLCQQNRPQPQYKIDNTIRMWGHDVIRLPPGHPELNAIEQVWGFMKRYVRSTLQRFTRTELRATLDGARQLVHKDVWAGAVQHSRKYEEEYWKTDNIHESVEPIIINIASDDEDDDIFLDSDCE